MSDVNLTQNEADALIAAEKHRIDNKRYDFPGLGGSLTIQLVSSNKRENFILDIRRGRIDLNRATYQNRGRQVVTLIRLDLGAQPHRNPDQKEIPSPHLHIYREGYGDKWAEPLPADKFSNIKDLFQTIQDFMAYCNITLPPLIDKGLFS